MPDFRGWLRAAAEAFGLDLGAEQEEKCAAYTELLLRRNAEMNLTRIVEPQEIAVKHFIDAAAPLRYGLVGEDEHVIDVGTGAGFPGVVLKILRPRLRLVLLDALAKRLRFLEEVVRVLGLDGVELVHARAEEVGRGAPHREAYGVATARAVAELRVLAEYVLPLVKVGGAALAWKGPDVAAEAAAAQRALAELGAESAEVLRYDLPFGLGGRSLVVVRKVRPTPSRYPRKPGEPARRPLGG